MTVSKMRASMAAALVLALGVLSACSGSADSSQPNAVTPSAPLGASMDAVSPAPIIPVPTPTDSQVPVASEADARACYLGYVVIDSYWPSLVKAANSKTPISIGASNMKGLHFVIAKAGEAKPDDADLAAVVTSLRRRSRALQGDAIGPRQARAIGRDLVALRRWCSARGMDDDWFARAQNGPAN